MTGQEERDNVAMEKYGKKFEECTPEERISVGGTIGGRKRAEDIGPEGYSAMGSGTDPAQMAKKEGSKNQGDE